MKRVGSYRSWLVGLMVAGLAAATLGARGFAQTSGSGELIGEGMAQFLPEGVARGDLPPSFALAEPAKEAGPVPGDWEVRPKFACALSKCSASIETEPGTDFYGTGEIAGPLRRNGYVTRAWNSGAAAYTDRTKNLYQSHPWVLAARPDGSAFGVLADTSYEVKIDLTRGIRLASEHPFPVIVIEGESPQVVMKRLAALIGTMPLPPRWSLGYQQCRYSYYPEARVQEIADEFRNRKLPCDVIWLDIHYMDGYRIFTFDPERFPDPVRMNKYLHDRGFKSIWMIDPGVKKEPGYFVYDQGTAGGYWVQDKHGREYNGAVWPGTCAFPDYTMPETRSWWAGLYKDFMATGIDGVWNDMNEPAVFNLRGTMPKSNLHRGGGGLPPGDHSLYHNVWGMLMVRATREGIMAANPDKRPFVLSRANFIGGQRYAAAWTGDNVADWPNVKYSVTMVMNLGLSGQPFSGPDIGGHIGPGTPEQFARWFGVGVFFPFSRGHTTNGNIAKEPWAFGPEVEASCRTALERRYRLLPYYYTLFREHELTGMPVMRPVFFADPADPKLRGEDDAFLIGSDLLALPQLGKQADYVHTVPEGNWRTVSLVGEDHETDVNQPELRVRPGAIVPLGRVAQNTTEESLAPLTLVVNLDESGRAAGELYEDAGDGYSYNNGDYLLTRYEAVMENGKVMVKIASTEGSRPRPARETVVEVVTDDGVFTTTGDERGIIEVLLKGDK